MVKKNIHIKNILNKALQQQCFNQRINTGKLAHMWSDVFGNDFGQLVKRDGDTLFVNVKGAPQKSELENFKKWDILDTLHTLPEFSAIRDIRFMEI